MLPLTPPASDTSRARGPKVAAGGDLQEEAVESEGPALENRLTYRKRCVRAIVCGLDGKGEGEEMAQCLRALAALQRS